MAAGEEDGRRGEGPRPPRRARSRVEVGREEGHARGPASGRRSWPGAGEGGATRPAARTGPGGIQRSYLLGGGHGGDWRWRSATAARGRPGSSSGLPPPSSAGPACAVRRTARRGRPARQGGLLDATATVVALRALVPTGPAEIRPSSLSLWSDGHALSYAQPCTSGEGGGGSSAGRARAPWPRARARSAAAMAPRPTGEGGGGSPAGRARAPWPRTRARSAAVAAGPARIRPPAPSWPGGGEVGARGRERPRRTDVASHVGGQTRSNGFWTSSDTLK